VVGPNGEKQGANILMHDVSSETTLEERCQDLHEKATRDPLTQVANRAEFDRQQQKFIDAHVARDEPCSLIICDIDHFKKVNDTYGHPAGDEALRTFARLLSDNCRPNDLVARYGGEEFVILCADCDLATAVKRAEKIRQTVEKRPLESLGGKQVTASFGVTQTCGKDTAKSMLMRADQALLQAKSDGRNKVVQVKPNGQVATSGSDRGWFGRRKTSNVDPVLEADFVADVPLRVAVEKLRGFVSEYKMDVEPLDTSRVLLKFDPDGGGMLRRQSDRSMSFLMELTFGEEQVTSGSRPGQIQTRVSVAMRPRRSRDRRRTDVVDRARRLAGFLQSYLLAKDANECEEEAERRDTTLVGTWLAP
jgi:diguanylate cyclase (GGDEF)-like protein